jgi:multisubunit Na+/H+ antiporter MnhE subunit
MVIIDYIVSILFFCEALTLPSMLLYLFSPYHTFNLVTGVVVGCILTPILLTKFTKVRRIISWLMVFNLSIVFLIVLKQLCT